MEQGKAHTPDWLFGTIPHQMIFSTRQEVQDYLIEVNIQPTINTHNRWYFFNL